MVFEKGNKINLGRKKSPEEILKLGIARSLALKGKPISNEHKKKIGLSNLGKRLGKHDLSPNPVKLEKRNPYRWNILVLRLLSPEHKCISCNKVFELNKLHLHHSDIFNRQPETVDPKTIQVLCHKCHKQADMKLWKEYKNKEMA